MQKRTRLRCLEGGGRQGASEPSEASPDGFRTSLIKAYRQLPNWLGMRGPQESTQGTHTSCQQLGAEIKLHSGLHVPNAVATSSHGLTFLEKGSINSLCLLESKMLGTVPGTS